MEPNAALNLDLLKIKSVFFLFSASSSPSTALLNMKLEIFGCGVKATLKEGKLVAENITKKTEADGCISLYGQEATMITMVHNGLEKDTCCVTGCGNVVGRNATINIGSNVGHGNINPQVFNLGDNFGMVSGGTMFFSSPGGFAGYGHVNPQVFVNGVDVSSAYNASPTPTVPTSTEGIEILPENKIKTIVSSRSSTIVILDSTCVDDYLSFHLKGSSDVTISDSKFLALDINISGAASFDLNKVEIESFDVVVKGSGTIKGENTAAKTVGIRISGSGSVKGIHVKERGDLRISGSGSIRLTRDKDADIEQKVSGSGDISVKKKVERD